MEKTKEMATSPLERGVKLPKRREQRTTSYCTHDFCDHDTVRKGYVRCEISWGLCAYQTQHKPHAQKAT